MAPRLEIAVGLKRGHPTIKNKLAPRPASKKGVRKSHSLRLINFKTGGWYQQQPIILGSGLRWMQEPGAQAIN